MHVDIAAGLHGGALFDVFVDGQRAGVVDVARVQAHEVDTEHLVHGQGLRLQPDAAVAGGVEGAILLVLGDVLASPELGGPGVVGTNALPVHVDTVFAGLWGDKDGQ